MKRWVPWFIADWESAVFMHFRVNPQKLRTLVPYQLDTWNGHAIVSLVAFTQSRLRPAGFGRLGERLSTPLAHHDFLNLRTYVRNGDQAGIFFLSEWIPNRLAALIGPATYGLPYRMGTLRYATLPDGRLAGEVKSGRKKLSFRGNILLSQPARIASPGSIEHFLVERYAAFTHRHAISRRFSIRHAPWRLSDVSIQIFNNSLLDEFMPHLSPLELICAQHSAGVFNVQISGPQRQTSIQKEDTLRMPCPCGENYVQSQC